MKHKKRIIVLLVVAAFLGVLFFGRKTISQWIGGQLAAWLERADAFPREGRYFCEELDIELRFFPFSCLAVFSGGMPENVSVGYGGRFSVDIMEDGCSVGTKLYALYSWDQKKDVIRVEVEEYEQAYDPNRDYLFERIAVNDSNRADRIQLKTMWK